MLHFLTQFCLLITNMASEHYFPGRLGSYGQFCPKNALFFDFFSKKVKFRHFPGRILQILAFESTFLPFLPQKHVFYIKKISNRGNDFRQLRGPILSISAFVAFMLADDSIVSSCPLNDMLYVGVGLHW